jgi:hypothetical protein
MKKEIKIKIGIAVLLLGLLIPVITLITLGPPDWPNNERKNLIAFAVLFCVGLRAETKTFREFFTQYILMLVLGTLISAISITLVLGLKDNYFYWAAGGLALALVLTIGGTWAIKRADVKQSKNNHKAHSAT